MATYHCSMSVGHGAKGVAHFDYIERDGRYSGRDDLITSKTGNLPAWAKSPRDFWERTSLHDKRSYREIEFALPNELSKEEQQRIVEEFIRDYLPDKAYSYALHEPSSRLRGEKNPHVHIMFSERIIDDRVRNMTEEEFFKKNGRAPNGKEFGGAIKDRRWSGKGSTKALRELRQDIADRINDAYKRNGMDLRITAKSLEAQKRERYAEADIEGGTPFDREKPYRAPAAVFIAHAKEIAAAGEGRFDPEQLKNPAARLRAYQEIEKIIVQQEMEAIRAVNEELKPNEAEIYISMVREKERLEGILKNFPEEDSEGPAAQWYRSELAALLKRKDALQAVIEKKLDAGKQYPLRLYSQVAANGEMEDSAAIPKANEPEKQIRAIHAVLENVKRQEAYYAARTARRLAEQEANQRTGGKVAAINKELGELSKAELPSDEKKDVRRRLEQEKRSVLDEALSEKDWGACYKEQSNARIRLWRLGKILERLERDMNAIAESAGLSRDQVQEICAPRIAAQKTRPPEEIADPPAAPEVRTVPSVKPVKEPDVEKQSAAVRPEKQEPAIAGSAPEKTANPKEAPAIETAPQEKSATAIEAEQKEALAELPDPMPKPEPEILETPDMRALKRAIGDLERIEERAEKKIIALRSITMDERTDAKLDALSHGRLTKFRKEKEAELKRIGHPSEAVEEGYCLNRQLLLPLLNAAVKKELAAAAVRDERRASGLEKYIRSVQAEILQPRAALSALRDKERAALLAKDLRALASVRPVDFVSRAMNEATRGELYRKADELNKLREAGAPAVQIKTADDDLNRFIRINNTAIVKARIEELQKANQAEQERLRALIRSLEKNTETREPFVSRYYAERRKLLDDAVKRRAWLYEKTVIQLRENPEKLRYYYDQVINEKSGGVMNAMKEICIGRDETLRRTEEASARAGIFMKEDLPEWKEVWGRKKIGPLKGRGHRIKPAVLREEKQKAETAIILLRKDYNVPEVWNEARKRWTQHKQEMASLREQERNLRKKLDKDQKRRYLSVEAKQVLNRAAQLADKLLGIGDRGRSLGANIRINNRGDDFLER